MSIGTLLLYFYFYKYIIQFATKCLSFFSLTRLMNFTLQTQLTISCILLLNPIFCFCFQGEVYLWVHFFVPFGFIKGNIKRKIFTLVMHCNLGGKERRIGTITLNINCRRLTSIRQRKTAFTNYSLFENNFQ